jgi:ribonuclease VapC
MIAVDTSALMAIALDEPVAEACMAALEAEDEILISAGTLAEVLIVSARRRVGAKMAEVLDGFDLNIVPVTPAAARRIGEAYSRWGRGMHPAALNFGDCFAYALARATGEPLLFKGDDFRHTDIMPALNSSGTASKRR